MDEFEVKILVIEYTYALFSLVVTYDDKAVQAKEKEGFFFRPKI
jgi:hypothetical protein